MKAQKEVRKEGLEGGDHLHEGREKSKVNIEKRIGIFMTYESQENIPERVNSMCV